ncbi:hypothetical protein BSPLISOX_507 [uncultured Gammaproteobacteria bacterium]|nr:hypothetical protein BSPLISOX_507 [uncultured Gammaproteobacteria bacterium]
MKTIKLFVISMLLLSSFQAFSFINDDPFLRLFYITTDDVSTPENTDKVIELATNKDDYADITDYTITGDAYANWHMFTLRGNKLTFKATAFKAGSNTYRIKIKAVTWVVIPKYPIGIVSPDPVKLTTEKTLTVTVTKNPDDDEALRITTADVSTPENTDKVITLITNKSDTNLFRNMITTFDIGGGADAKRFTLAGNKLTFKATAFKARNNTYRVNIRVLQSRFDRGFEGNLPETAYKTLTVTVTKNPDDDGALRITTAADVSTPENTDKVITLITNKSDTNVFKNMLTIFTIVDGADAKRFTLKKGNKLTFKATAFKAQSNTYRVKIKVFQERFDRGFSPWAFPPSETAYKTLTVTVINPNTGDNPDNDGALRITTADVSTPENTDKVMTLITNKSDTNVFKNMVTQFSIVGGADAKRFTLKKGNKLTFKATAFKAQSNTYHVKIKVFQELFDRDFIAWPTPPLPETAYKTLAVTVTEAIEKKGNIEELIVEDDNAKVSAQAVRKESKSASKLLLSKVGKTLMGRLSHIRHKNKQKSSFSANGFVNGIQVSFADSQTNSFINRVLSANGLSNVIPISSRKLERWDTWTNAKVVIGKSNGAGVNKTEFNLKSLNIGMDRRIAQDKIIGFAIDRTATGSDFSGEVDTTQYTLSSYGALELSDKGSIEAVLGVAKATHNISNSADQGNSNGFFASIAYRADLQAQGVDLSPFIRYDISRIKMKANDILTSSETTTDKAIALGIDISKTANYKEGQLTRFVSVKYKSDLRRDGNDYLSKNAEQEVMMKLGLDYQKDDTTTSVSYERIQSTNNKAHSYGIEGAVRWKF